jgi:hypothetical protein
MLGEALWGLHHLLDGATSDDDADARVARMLSAGFGPEEKSWGEMPHPLVVQLAAFLGSVANTTSTLHAPALKVLGAIVSTSDSKSADFAFAAGVLKPLRRILGSSNSPAQLREDAAWNLSNIAAGSVTQAKKLLDEPGVLDALKAGLDRSNKLEVRRECAFSISNLVRQGAPVLSRLDVRELLRVIKAALSSAVDPVLHSTLLEAVETCFRQADIKAFTKKPILDIAKNVGLANTLEELQRTASESVRQKAVLLLNTFFGTDGENAAPNTSSTSQQLRTGYKSPKAALGIHGGSPAQARHSFRA